MVKEILKVLGGAMGMFIKFILIIAMSLGGLYCLGTVFFLKFFTEGLVRLAVAAGCVLGVIALIRTGREKDEGPTEDDFRP